MSNALACVFCGTAPESIRSANPKWIWHQVRCRNPRCIEHGTTKYPTEEGATRRWNARQVIQKNILRNAAQAVAQQRTRQEQPA